MAILLVAGCTSSVKAPIQGNVPSPSVVQSNDSQRTTNRQFASKSTASIPLQGEVYTVELASGADQQVAAVATAHGIVWSRPQAQTGEGLERHPIEPATLYLSPYQKGGGDLSTGARELLTFPLTIRYPETGADLFLTVTNIDDAGDWVALLLNLRAQGWNQAPWRLDVVNLKTGDHQIVTDAQRAGGMNFIWRTEPGRVYWEQQSLGQTVASRVVDLETGKAADVPPGTAQRR